ncbi:hypothetical protein BGW36DRAFT_8829 [Talaromyces proteolyticus]|uniref:Uncharacterized protein n=1 Tax=Talaromyces proteolyticus TaxID=1131652 RepID=A0AAD4Q131_9EURO|nr:uncharacterized protein BGW36DRAFT_8829 [Talaromyces proteolyticus]KAH8705175.1 hypothetical protein BGW36DRAFT_8829 [Talaromyces proteolyticus]
MRKGKLEIHHAFGCLYIHYLGRGNAPFGHYQKIAGRNGSSNKGAFIVHRAHGSTTDITPNVRPAVTKMKAIITQRFDINSAEVDAEPDNRLLVWGDIKPTY